VRGVIDTAMNFRDSLADYRVLPVVTAYTVHGTVRLAQSLAAAGMGAIEITLRTDCAAESIRAVREAVPGITVAAGTVCGPRDLQLAEATGAQFCVSPGLTPGLLQAAADSGVPLLPGVASASDILLGLEHGLDVFKFFPAAAAGGIDMLKALAGPFPQVAFCPTGGLTAANFREYLALPNVLCCGGSWMVASALVQEEQWDMIKQLAAEAVSTSAARATGEIT